MLFWRTGSEARDRLPTQLSTEIVDNRAALRGAQRVGQALLPTHLVGLGGRR